MEMKDYALLRIFTDEMAISGDHPLSEVILQHARDNRLLGVTVLRGTVGFGHANLVHAAHFLDHNCPLVIEIVDQHARLHEFAAEIANMKGIGLITLAPVELLVGGNRND